MMANIAGNKVERLATIRAIGLLIFVGPGIPWFIDSGPTCSSACCRRTGR